MSNLSFKDQYEQKNEIPSDGTTSDPIDNSYVSRTGQSQIPVQKDEAPVEDPIDPDVADSNEQLASDDKEAIDQSNIMDSCTRGATKQAGTYAEPGMREVFPALGMELLPFASKDFTRSAMSDVVRAK
ncbi:uncharacterized protein BDR25DRAFT_257644 [Lindgomyces ingoldianus]|uniref:Uncharacterized protein n=1 Tax=Lindgomyces ingoldianus TaxID=673940 RepID=A0ACB6R4S8_9PLEO|nr:uncharacterized protein BDR25DRAFT_257644 [Lindgomyces ingoldianus]KAF2473302.1 hypothetical protein BDR25DRAFT_257644 [Lindgomyces ingoldianus]